MATYLGWLMHGTLGGIAAGVLFVLPRLYPDRAVVDLHDVGKHAAGGWHSLRNQTRGHSDRALRRLAHWARALRNETLWAISAAAFLATTLQ